MTSKTPRRRYRVRIAITTDGAHNHPYHMDDLDPKRVRTEEVLDQWEKILDEHGAHPQTTRMVRDHLEFYDTLVHVLDQGFTFKLKMTSGIGVNAPDLAAVPELGARFLNRRHLDKFLSVVIDSGVKGYDDKYL